MVKLAKGAKAQGKPKKAPPPKQEDSSEDEEMEESEEELVPVKTPSKKATTPAKATPGKKAATPAKATPGKKAATPAKAAATPSNKRATPAAAKNGKKAKKARKEESEEDEKEEEESGETPRQREHSRARHRGRTEGRGSRPLPPPEASVGSRRPSPHDDVAPAIVTPVPEALSEDEVVEVDSPPRPHLSPAVQEEEDGVMVVPPALPAVPPLPDVNCPFPERREAVEKRLEWAIDGINSAMRQLRHLHDELNMVREDYRSLQEGSLHFFQTRGADDGTTRRSPVSSP